MAEWLAVDDYIDAVSEAQDQPPTLSREDAVLLSLFDKSGLPGSCWACGADITDLPPGTRHCPACAQVGVGLRGMFRLRRPRRPKLQVVSA